MTFLQKNISLVFLLLWVAHIGYTQTRPNIPQPVEQEEQDTTKNDRITVDFADVFEYIIEGDSTIQRLVGDVELRQDSVFMYCDSATIIGNTRVIAMGNVIIQQGDSTSVFADSLDYLGDEKKAALFGDVILTEKGQQLFTNRLNYDVDKKIATYTTGATLINNETQLTSKIGYFFTETNQAFFKDSVIVVDPDFTLRSDTLQFDTEQNIVTFLGPTLISTDSSKIYCESGFYDTENDKAEFTQNAQFVKDKQQARAETITYDGREKEYVLSGNARFKEEERDARAEVIRYNEKTDKTFMEGNARYKDGEQNIVSDKITYDGKSESYATSGRSFVSDPPQLLEADSIDFNNESGLGFAFGQVIWQDTSENLTIRCEVATYNKKSDYFKATGGRPLLITIVEDDSLFMTSDTLVSITQTPGKDTISVKMAQDTVLAADLLKMDKGVPFLNVDSTSVGMTSDSTLSPNLLKMDKDIPFLEADSTAIATTYPDPNPDYPLSENNPPSDTLLSPTLLETNTDIPFLQTNTTQQVTSSSEVASKTDTTRMLIAYPDVRIFKENMQAVCDSLVYNTTDSLFTFYKNPIIWSDTSQFYADTISMRLVNNNIDKIYLYNNAFIINSPDEQFFNQIKGNNIIAYFVEEELRRMRVMGNAESIYFALDDDDAYIGMNKTQASELMVYFGNNEVQRIKFIDNPTALLTPMQQIKSNQAKMEGFQWEKKRRPQKVEDLFAESIQ